MKLAIVFALFAVCAFGQLVEVGIVDDFFIGQNIQKAQVTLTADLNTSQPPEVAESSFSGDANCNVEFGNTLIGCSRDMQMEVTSGDNGRSFDSEIFSISGDANFRGEWVVANPKTSSSTATLQYDGIDNTFVLNENGLNNFDLTFGGIATEFRLSVVSDLQIAYTTIVYTSSGICQAVINVPATPGTYNYEDTFFDLQYSAFTGPTGCNFASVGAIELVLPSTDAVDAIVRKISVLGVLPSDSQTPTPAPSQSNTPTPVPSQSNTPTRPPTESPTPSQTPTPTPSRSTECTVVCNCPAFSCHLVFNFDDDDFFFYF